MKSRQGSFTTGIAATATLLLLIAFAVAGDVGISLAATMVAAAVVAVAFFNAVFPGSVFFSLALTNSIAMYVSMFVFLSESNFRGISPLAQHAGFLLPVAGFILGAFLRRGEIRGIVTEQQVRPSIDLRGAGWWLVPTAGICAATFAIPAFDPERRFVDVVFLLAMSSVSVLVLAAARNVAIFLIDAGLLFEEFFERLERLVLPVYAFLTFYFLIVVAFAALYKIVDRFAPGPHFKILGDDRAVAFADAIYFSVVTLSTVGYGDILPVSEAVRLIALIQVVLGITLLLVGFSEIMSYSREIEARRRNAGKGGPDA
jgi:voltage-gated potassium channel